MTLVCSGPQQWQSTFPSNDGSVSLSSASQRGEHGSGLGSEDASGHLVVSQVDLL